MEQSAENAYESKSKQIYVLTIINDDDRVLLLKCFIQCSGNCGVVFSLCEVFYHSQSFECFCRNNFIWSPSKSFEGAVTLIPASTDTIVSDNINYIWFLIIIIIFRYHQN